MDQDLAQPVPGTQPVDRAPAGPPPPGGAPAPVVRIAATVLPVALALAMQFVGVDRIRARRDVRHALATGA